MSLRIVICYRDVVCYISLQLFIWYFISSKQSIQWLSILTVLSKTKLFQNWKYAWQFTLIKTHSGKSRKSSTCFRLKHEYNFLFLIPSVFVLFSQCLKMLQMYTVYVAWMQQWHFPSSCNLYSSKFIVHVLCFTYCYLLLWKVCWISFFTYIKITPVTWKSTSSGSFDITFVHHV